MRRPLCLLALILAVAYSILLMLAPDYEDPYQSLDGQSIILEGTVTAKEYKTGTSTWTGEETLTLLITVNHVELTGYDCPSADKVLVRIPVENEDNDVDPAARIGARVRIQGTLAALAPATNSGGFDSSLYYRTLGYRFQVRSAALLSASGRGHLLDNALYVLRQRMHRALYRCCVSEEDADILAAMLLGEKGQLSQEIRDLYQSAGIIHILAISGLHIQIIGMGCYQLLARTHAPRPLCAGAAAVLMLLYGRMTGVSASSCRALIMFLLHILARQLHRTYDLLSALSIAGMLILMEEPLYLCNAGFLFSFAAVLSIGLLTPLLPENILPAGIKGVLFRGEQQLRQRAQSRCRKMPGKRGSQTMPRLPGISLQGLAATIGTFPVNLYSYGTFPLYSVVLNALVLPLMSLVMVLGLLILGAGATLQLPGQILALPAHYLLHFYRILCRIAAGLPGHIQVVGRPTRARFVIFLVLMGVLVFLEEGIDIRLLRRLQYMREGSRDAGRLRSPEDRGYRLAMPSRGAASVQRTAQCRRLPGIVVLLWMVGCLHLLVVHRSQGLWIHVIDVGQGDGIYIECDDRRILIDGGSTDQSDVARYDLEPLLTYYGAGTIDLAIMTHEDQDHMNGLLTLLTTQDETGIRIRRLAMPDVAVAARGDNYLAVEQAARATGTELLYLHQGSVLTMGELTLTCLNPAAGAIYTEPNATSVTLYLTYGSFTALLTGDLEEDGERDCLTYMASRPDLFPRTADGDPVTCDQVTFLKTAHHGSKGATTENFLAAVHPVIATISCGKENRYGHPHAETLERLAATGARILDTRYTGEITISTDGRSMRLQTYRITDNVEE